MEDNVASTTACLEYQIVHVTHTTIVCLYRIVSLTSETEEKTEEPLHADACEMPPATMRAVVLKGNFEVRMYAKNTGPTLQSRFAHPC